MAAFRWNLNMMLAATALMIQFLSAQEASDLDATIENDDDIIRQEMAQDSIAAVQSVTTEATSAVETVKTEASVAPVATPAIKADAVKAPKVASTPKDESVLTLETDVVVGYGISKKSSLTGAVTTVDSKAFTKSSVITVDKALQGKAAGVFATQNSGAPGKEMSVRIRGVGSVNSTNPLYIVDGVPTSSISHLSPQDIESISILKDAPSAAIYGSRAANGVILVTTKKGKSGDRVITYDAQFGFQNAWKKPDMVNAAEWASLRSQAELAGKVSGEDLTDFTGEDLSQSTDWWEEVINKNAPMLNQSVSVSGGNEKASYFLSGNFSKQEGIILGSDYSKVGLRSNLNSKIQDWLSLGYNLGISGSKTSKADESDEWNSVIMTAQSLDPVSKPRDEHGNLTASDYTQSFNPVGRIENTHNNLSTNNLIGNLFTDVSLGEKVKNHTSFGVEYDAETQKKFIPSYYIGGEDQVVTNSIKDGFVNKFNWTFENSISYDNTFGDAHAVKLLAGFTAEEENEDSTAVTGYQAVSNDSLQWYQDATTLSGAYEANGNSRSSALMSGFGRASYELYNKYFISASVRADGSSKFSKENRWGVFPSVSGAWRISEEGFMQNADVISNLKLRGGWGMLGNQDIGDYGFMTTTTNGNNYSFGGVIQEGSTFLSTGTADIHWEKQTSVNAGFDIGFLDDKIELNTDLFDKKTTDMLVAPTIPSIAGYETPPTVNKGEIDNKGLEAVLSYKETWGNFDLDFGSNISIYRNEVLSLGANGAVIVDGGAFNKGEITRTEVGHSVGEFYGLVTDGLFQTQEEINNYVNADGDMIQPDAQPGDIKYKADPVTGEWTYDYIGSPHPDFVYGFNIGGTYKAFDISMGFQGSHGNEIFNATRFNIDNNAATYGLSKHMLDAWNGANSTNDVSLAAMNTATADNNMLISDRYIEDGSYLRIKSLQVGFTLPEAASAKIHFSKLRVFTGVENLATFTKYSGLDPEIGAAEGNGAGEQKNDQITTPSLSMGVDRGTYPQSRTFYFGVSCTL